MAHHGTGVAQTEVDVVDAVCVCEVNTFCILNGERNTAGIPNHPVERNALQQAVFRTFKVLDGSGMQFVEKFQFFSICFL